MSNQLKIKLSVANRIYPLTIQPNQEEGLRRAAKQIEEMLLNFEQNYSVQDKQDVLAMCALQLASQIEQNAIKKTDINDEVLLKIDGLHDLIDAELNA